MVAIFQQPALQRGKRRMEGDFRFVGRELVGRAFDHGDLQIDQVADPSVIADFPQPPRDLAQHARALADRCQPLLQRQAVERLDRRYLGVVDGTTDGSERFGQPLLRRVGLGDRFGGLLRRKPVIAMQAASRSRSSSR